MKTRQRDSSGTPGLPPAPAPPSRDANPWSMSGQGDDAPKLHPRVREAVRNADRKHAPPGVVLELHAAAFSADDFLFRQQR